MAIPADDLLAEPLAPVPEPEPPARDLSPRQWVQANLASTPLNAALTAVIRLFCALITMTGWAGGCSSPPTGPSSA